MTELDLLEYGLSSADIGAGKRRSAWPLADEAKEALREFLEERGFDVDTDITVQAEDGAFIFIQ